MVQKIHLGRNLSRKDITFGCKIRRAGESTKICPECGNKIIKGLFHVSISNSHRTKLNGEPYTYSNDCVYIHTDCWKSFSLKISKKIKELKEDLMKNKLEVMAKKI